VRKAIKAIAFLSAAIAAPLLTQSRGLRVVVRRDGLPVGAGLGSSAALSVAAAASLLRLRAIIETKNDPADHTDQLTTGGRPDPAWQARINAWAFASEVVMTGTPSGIDNTVSCYGALVKYQKALDGSTKIQLLEGLPLFEFLLTNTLVPRETSVLVAGLRQLRESSASFTHAVDSMFDAIEAITEEFMSLVTHPKESRHVLGSLSQLVRMNHSLLNALGVGHPHLDAVAATAHEFGFATKLTGAGGGGCAFTVLGAMENGDQAHSDEASPAAYGAPLEAALQAKGYECFRSQVAGAGVLWTSVDDEDAAKQGHWSATQTEERGAAPAVLPPVATRALQAAFVLGAGAVAVSTISAAMARFR